MIRKVSVLAVIMLLVGYGSALKSTGADKPKYLVLISDSHLGFQQSNDAFSDFLQDVRKLPFKVQAIINNGDIAEVGRPEVFDYYVRQMNELHIPHFDVIGNHDTRWSPTGKEAFIQHIGPRYFSKDFWGMHWMFLDTTLDHQTQGHLDFREMDWIKNDLQQTPKDKPILVFSHHPLLWRGISVDNGMDVFNLFKGHRVAAFFNGHGHKLERMVFRGFPFIENDALFHHQYLILQKSGDKIQLYAKTFGDSELHPWLDFSLLPESNKIAEKETNVKMRPLVSPFQESKSFPLGEVYSGLVTDGKRIFCGTLDGAVWALDSNGKILWEKGLNGSILSSPVYDKGVLYVASDAGTLVALNAMTGATKWTFSAKASFAAPPFISENSLFIGSGDHSFYAINLATGKEQWRVFLGDYTEAQAVADSQAVYVGAWDHTFYALNRENGDLLWKKNIGKAIYYSPSVVHPILLGDNVIVTGKNHQIYAFDQRSGDERWKVEVNDGFTNSVIMNHQLLVPETSGGLAILDPDTGETLWRKKFSGSFYNASPVSDGDELFLITVEGKLIAFNVKSQTVDKEVQVSRGFNFSTPVIADGKLWVGSLDGNLYSVPLAEIRDSP